MSATLTINTFAVKKNIERIKGLVGNSAKYCFVAKANCYGFGIEVCKRVEAEVDMFAVSSGAEFFSLRKIISKPILILDPVYEEVENLAKLGAVFTISSKDALAKLTETAKQTKVQIKAFIKLNTGMNRFGFVDDGELKKACGKIKKTQNISVLGVFSHYFDANNEIFAKTQLGLFKQHKEILEKFLGKNLIYSISSTGGIYLDPMDLVRIGIGNYTDMLFTTITLKSQILEFQTLDIGESAGYNSVFVANRKTKLAVVGIGYGDGLPRRIFKSGKVLIRGNFCNIVAVCMDSILVDVTDISAKILDDVILIGRSKNKQIFICDVAKWCDTIIYEIIVNISARVKRNYVEEKSCKSLQVNTEQEN